MTRKILFVTLKCALLQVLKHHTEVTIPIEVVDKYCQSRMYDVADWIKGGMEELKAGGAERRRKEQR